jgi:hypothetical protein
MRLLTPGVGIGLVLAFGASIARLWVANLGLWLVVAGLTTTLLFALGYFSPTPEEKDEFDEDEEFDEEDDDLMVFDEDTKDVSANEQRR